MVAVVWVGVPRIVALAGAFLLGCASPVITVTYERLGRAGSPIPRRIAVAPIETAPAFVVGEPDSAASRYAADLVLARLVEALDERGFEVVPPAEVQRVLRDRGLEGVDRSGAEVGSALRSVFGAEAVLSVQLRLYRPRIGGERGAQTPAAVGFDVELRDAGGASLWRGSYQEVQASLAEDPGSFGRAFGRRFRWVSSEELASYGARELIGSLPRSWSDPDLSSSRE